MQHLYWSDVWKLSSRSKPFLIHAYQYSFSLNCKQSSARFCIDSIMIQAVFYFRFSIIINKTIFLDEPTRSRHNSPSPLKWKTLTPHAKGHKPWLLRLVYMASQCHVFSTFRPRLPRLYMSSSDQCMLRARLSSLPIGSRAANSTAT